MATVEQTHCDKQHENEGLKISDLYDKVNRKAPMGYFVSAVIASALAIGAAYIAIFTFSTGLSANDAAIRSEIAAVKLEAAERQAALRSDIRDLATNVQALTKATEENNKRRNTEK